MTAALKTIEQARDLMLSHARAVEEVEMVALTETLGRVLARPTRLPVPRFALKFAFGEMADEMMLAGARVVPRRLLDLGYRFREAGLEPTLRRMLAPGSPTDGEPITP